jgi:hypothetical protein
VGFHPGWHLLLKILRVILNMITDKARDEVVTMIVTWLHADFAGKILGITGSLEIFRQ